MQMLIKNLLERNAYAIAITLTILIIISSLISISSLGIKLIRVENSDKYAHIISYFILSMSWFYASQHDFKSTRQKLILIALLVAFGIIIEALQEGITTYRHADIYDVLANSVGILLAAILFKPLNSWLNSMLK